MKWNEIKLKEIRPETLKLLSDPQGNVQGCLSIPQEKRAQAQEKKLKPQME